MIAQKTRGADKPLALGALERLWLPALVAAALLLSLINLPYAPITWFDEGSHLHVPKTLVRHGVYADISSEGYRYYGPTVGVGPTVMLPIALAFRLFGVGLLQGRLVIVAYALVALAAFFALARGLHGRRVALLGLTLLLASRTATLTGFGQYHRQFDGLLDYGRQVLGEVPGTAFLLLGALAWLAALRAEGGRPTASSSPGRRWPVLGGPWALSLLSGLGFGLALVTKNQFVLIIPPALALLALLDWRYYRAATWRLRLAPPLVACACFALWTLVQLQFLGPGSFMENVRQTRQAAGGAIFVFDLGATLRAGRHLLRPGLYGGLLVPALAYALWRARRRDAQGLAEALIALLIGLWLCWFVGASLGWARYAFPAVAFSALTVARMLADLIGWLGRRGGRGRWLAAGVAGYAALAAALPLALTARDTLRPDASAQRFAAYLDQHVPADAVVETWEPELGLLTDHRYHYPPIKLLDTAVREQWLGGAAMAYNGLDDSPPYVAIGPFGSTTGVYRPDILARDYVAQQQIGPYVLFRHR